jgi:hypothetical protein
MTVDQVVETFEAAREENQLSPLRKFQTVHLPAEGEVWVTGDLHDHRSNFAKLVRAADLGNNPQRHLILHELIHGEHFDPDGAEDSWRTLYQAAELKCDFPQQVHFLLANHDLAQIYGEGIVKSGRNVCEAFTAAVKRDFPSGATAVNLAISEFLLSLPLAIRCGNGLFICHSLPTDSQIETFDFTVFDRELKSADYTRRKGPVYQLIWGRGVTPAGAEAFAQKVSATFLITGHQPQEMGYLCNGEKHLIINSDHSQGVFVPVDLSQPPTMETVMEKLTKFVAMDFES